MIFDLDDTLYDESTFVLSGFRKVAKGVSSLTGMDPVKILEELEHNFATMPRGNIFDESFANLGCGSRSLVREAISIYRAHKPSLELLPGVREVLTELSSRSPIYLVTDGNKLVQSRKIDALGIEKYFARVFITHRFGLSAAKPSLLCFDKIRLLAAADWEELIYVGDDPSKDFVSLNSKGSTTVRVLQGRFKDVRAPRGYDARYSVGSVPEAKTLLENLPVQEAS